MSGALADRREEMLGLLAEKTLALACDLQARALATDDVDEKVKLATAFARLSRSCRQSLALHARLERDRLKAEREAQQEAETQAPAPEPPPPDPETEARARRKGQVRRAVERVLWDEYDAEDSGEEEHAFSLLEDLDDRLCDLDDTGDLMAADPDSLIAGLCRELGLEPPPPRPRLQLEPAAQAPTAEAASPPNGVGAAVHGPNTS